MEELSPRRGRPREKLPVLDVGMTAPERDLYDFFIRTHMDRKPDFNVADEIHLRNAALQYVLYLRQTKLELETGKNMSANRRSPLGDMREELDRFYGKDFKPQSEEKDAIADFLSAKSTRARRS